MNPNRSKFIVAGGFVALITAMILVTLGGFLRFVSIHDEINRLTNEHFTKTNLLNTMHIAVRERAISLIHLADLSDRFAQDAEVLRFDQLGSEFADARTALLGLPLTRSERELMEKQSRFTIEVRPLHERLIELASQGNIVAAHRFLSQQVIPNQNQVVETVRALHRLEDDEFQQQVKVANEKYRMAYVLFMTLLSISTVGFGAVITTVVARKIDSAETSLLKEKERYALAVRGANDGLWDWDTVTNEVYFSPRWKDMLGFEDHEVNNHLDEWVKRIHPDDAEKTLAALTAHLNGLSYYFESEHRLLHKDGKYRWFLMRGLALRDANSKAYRVAGSTTDVTERKRYERHLHQNESRLRIVLNHVVDGIFTTNQSGVIESANSAAEEMFGQKADEIIGRPFSQLLAEPHRKEFDKHLLEYANTGTSAILGGTTELRGQRKPATSFALGCTITEMQFGNERKLIVIARDLSLSRDRSKRTA